METGSAETIVLLSRISPNKSVELCQNNGLPDRFFIISKFIYINNLLVTMKEMGSPKLGKMEDIN